MNKFQLLFVMIGNLFLLSGCQQPPLTYDYLMQHPDVLQKQYEACRGEATPQCEDVVTAAENFSALAHQRAENAEGMGLEIMHAQLAGDDKKVKTLYAVVRATSPE